MEFENTDRGWSDIERSERSCIRNRSGVGRAERELVSRKDEGKSRGVGFERGCIGDIARIQRGDQRWIRSSIRAVNISGSAIWCEGSFRGRPFDSEEA